MQHRPHTFRPLPRLTLEQRARLSHDELRALLAHAGRPILAGGDGSGDGGGSGGDGGGGGGQGGSSGSAGSGAGDGGQGDGGGSGSGDGGQGGAGANDALTAAQKAAAAADRRAREAEKKLREKEEAEATAKGEHQKLAETRGTRITELEGEIKSLKLGKTVDAVARRLHFHDPAAASRLVDLSDVDPDDQATVEQRLTAYKEANAWVASDPPAGQGPVDGTNNGGQGGGAPAGAGAPTGGALPPAGAGGGQPQTFGLETLRSVQRKN